jgi:GNAT superfamily N-acetyltransferase
MPAAPFLPGDGGRAPRRSTCQQGVEKGFRFDGGKIDLLKGFSKPGNHLRVARHLRGVDHAQARGWEQHHPTFRGLGLARRLIDRLAEHARDQGVTVLRLETGIHQHEAIRLYERMGFRQIPPFDPYRPDPLSLFYERVSR